MKTLDKYIQYLAKIKGLSANTIRNYKYDIALSEKVFGEIAENLPHLKNIDIELWASAGEVSKATVKRRIQTLKSYIKWLIEYENINTAVEPIKLTIPKQDIKVPEYLTAEEIKILINSISGKNKQRDKLIIKLAANLGLRLSEITNIRLVDISENNIKISGKGSKERILFIPSIIKKELENYTAKENRNVTDYVFLSRNGKRLSSRTVQAMVTKYLKAAGVYRSGLSCHSLRHSAATLMHDSGTSIATIKEVLGHSSLNTTMRYTHINNNQIKAAVLSNPVSSF